MAGMPIEVVPLAIYVLAFARLVYVVTLDDITEPIRDAVLERLDDRPRTLGAFISKLITCPWCASVWLGLAAAPLIWFHGNQPALLIVALVGALSQVAGMLSNVGR